MRKRKEKLKEKYKSFEEKTKKSRSGQKSSYDSLSYLQGAKALTKCGLKLI